MGVAREGVKAAFLLPILLLHLSCGQVVDGQRRDLQRVNPAKAHSAPSLLQVIHQLRSSPRYRPSRRPPGHQVTIQT